MKKNNKPIFSSGNCKISSNERSFLINNVRKRFGSELNANQNKMNYLELAFEINEAITNFFHEHVGAVKETFLRNFFTEITAIDKSYRLFNIDALAIYAFNKRWSDIKKPNETYFVFHYYDSENREFRRGILKAKENIAELSLKAESGLITIYKGDIEVLGNAIFFILSKQVGHAQKQIIIIYGNGSLDFGDYFVGVCSTSLIDGTPISYKIVLERTDATAKNQSSLFSRMPDAGIDKLIFEEFIFGENEIPQNVSKFKTLRGNDISEFTGKYKMFSSGRDNSIWDRVYEDVMEVMEHGEVIIKNPFSEKIKNGNIHVRDNKTLEIVMYDYGVRGEKKSIAKLFFILVNAYGKLALFLPGLCLTFDGNLNPTAYPVLITAKIELEKNDSFVQEYFKEFDKLRLNCLTLYEIEQIRKRLNI